MIRAILIEDEHNNRELLQQMLVEYCEGVEVVGMAVDVPSGIELIKGVKPDVIFLDVEMPGGNGFDILKAFKAPQFKIIFVTGYDHYAIKAIKYAALDYILKPINIKELQQAVEKIKDTYPGYRESLTFLKEQLDKEPEDTHQLLLSDNKNHKVLRFEEIIFIEAERTYVTFHLNNDQKYVATNPLSYYEDLLPETNFFRTHKSYIVNCQKVEKVETGRGGPVHLEGGAILPVAFRRKPAFVRFLEKIA